MSLPHVDLNAILNSPAVTPEELARATRKSITLDQWQAAAPPTAMAVLEDDGLFEAQAPAAETAPAALTMDQWQAAEAPEAVAPAAKAAPAETKLETPETSKDAEVLPDFKAIAEAMIAKGAHVVPVKTGEKACVSNNWQNLATRDISQIAEWAKIDPHYNVAVVAKPDGLWLFDDDKGILEEYESVYGLIKTYRVRSVSGGTHLYFLQNDESRTMGNIAGKNSQGQESWSARVLNRYVISAGSVAHPNNDPAAPLAQYRVVDRKPVIEAPSSFIAFLKSRSKAKPKTNASASADAPVLEGGRNNFLTNRAGKMREASLEYAEIESALVRINEEQCQPPLSDDEVRTIAASVSRYPAGKDDSVLIAGKLVGSAPLAGTASTATDTASSLQTKTANKIRTKKIKWLWDQRIPFGKLSVLAGNPDQGKSLVTMYMVSQLTAGRALYGSPVSMAACEVLVMAGEDEANDTIVPRLQAGDADLSKVHLVESVAVKDGKGLTVGEREAQLDTDIQIIETMLNDHPGIRLVIVDPLSNYLGRANMNREQEVRQVLVPLKNLAARTGVAIVAVMHLNKSTDASAIHRIGGAVAFTGVARAVWLFIEDPQEPTKHLMLRVKGNIAKRVGGLSYRIQAKPVMVEGSPDSQPYVEWTGQTEQVASDVLIGGKPVGRPDEKVQTAKDWLADFLSNGSETATDVKKCGAKAGFTWRTLERAKADLGVVSEKPGSVWEWSLPDQTRQEPIEF